MSAKIIVSYDGTANEDDAVALGRLLGQRRRRGLARLRAPHHRARQRARGHRPARGAALLDRGVELLGDPRRHATSSPTARPPRGSPRWPSARAPTWSCSARTPTPPKVTSRSATPPSACSKAAAWPSRSRRSTSPRRGATPIRQHRRRRRRRRRRARDGRGACRCARRRRSRRSPAGRRPARDRLPPRGRAGPRLDQLLRRPADRDRHLRRARASARRSACSSAARHAAVA